MLDCSLIPRSPTLILADVHNKHREMRMREEYIESVNVVETKEVENETSQLLARDQPIACRMQTDLVRGPHSEH